MFRKGILVLLASFLAYQYYQPSIVDSPIVKTENGLLKGKVAVSRSGKRFYEYFGIPYAKPPVGELRYEIPQPVENWEGVRLAQEYGAECAHINFLVGGRSTIEDCLFINVATPNIGKEQQLPVIVFIHGGLFISGSANGHGANYFIDEGIILVSMNYRLASLGFLNTGDGLIRGNMGLKDQILALEWVQKNIEAFGGDKSKVTIVGGSAGAVSVHYHLISPLSKGLFYRAISQSGSVLNSWALKHHPAIQAKRYARQLNCPTSDSREMVACLKRLPVAEILDVHMETQNAFKDMIALFLPTIEIIKEGAVLSTHPYDLIRSGRINPVPWMSGYNADEGKNESGIAFMEQNFATELPKLMLYDNGDKAHRTELFGKMVEFYFGNVKPAGVKTAEIYSRMFTDGMFAYGITESMKLHSEFQPVFPYYYTYHGKVQLVSLLMSLKGKYPLILEALYYFAEAWVNENILGRQPLLKGATHGVELMLLFEMTNLGSTINPGHMDYEMSSNLVQLWASFAKGQENIHFRGKPLTRLEKNAKEVKYLKLDKMAEIIPQPNIGQLKFWKKNSLIQ